MIRFAKSMFAAALLVCFAASSIVPAGVLKSTTTGKPDLKSVNAISFADNGVLLIGDGTGSQIIAVRTGDNSASSRLEHKIENIDTKLAARLGAKRDGIEILDFAVNPVSGTAYFAVRKQDDKSHLIFTIDGKGEIGEFELDQVEYARIKLSAGKVKLSRVTDVAWADGKVVAAGRGNETFTSAIFSIDAPLSHDAVGNVYSAETYHVSHRRWETKAPMSVLIPIKEDDKSYIVGAFSCTPIVKYPLDSIQPGAKIKGISIIELGSGNRPLDMFVYMKDGKTFVLANTFRFHHSRRPFGPSPYWTVKFEQDLLAENQDVNEKAIRRLGKDYQPATPKIEMVESFHGVMQMDKLDDQRALVLRDSQAGLSLEPLPLP